MDKRVLSRMEEQKTFRNKLEMREKQTNVEPWPLRLYPNANSKEAQLKFEFLMASGHIEWIRVAPKFRTGYS